MSIVANKIEWGMRHGKYIARHIDSDGDLGWIEWGKLPVPTPVTVHYMGGGTMKYSSLLPSVKKTPSVVDGLVNYSFRWYGLLEGNRLVWGWMTPRWDEIEGAICENCSEIIKPNEPQWVLLDSWSQGPNDTRPIKDDDDYIFVNCSHCADPDIEGKLIQ